MIRADETPARREAWLRLRRALDRAHRKIERREANRLARMLWPFAVPLPRRRRRRIKKAAPM